VWEAQDYRPAMRRFFHAMRADPDLLVDLDLEPGSMALDVGAYEGSWTSRVLERVGDVDLRIHAFEPEPGAAARLQAAFEGDPRVTTHPFGLAGRDREEAMSVGGHGSSVFSNPAVPGSFGTTHIRLRDVQRVLADQRVDRIAAIKVNIEGGEFELLDRLHDTGWLTRTGTVLVQFHEFAPGAYSGRRRNRRQLAETHRNTWCYPWVWERWDPR
jgi:FkbM family methyltransferase